MSQYNWYKVTMLQIIISIGLNYFRTMLKFFVIKLVKRINNECIIKLVKPKR